MAKKNSFLMYRGRPLVRKDNTIYYGSMSDEFVIVLQITSTKQFNDMTIADRVMIQLVRTDPDLSPRDRIVKKSEKRGLYNAMDIGSIWLERALPKPAEGEANDKKAKSEAK
ncbi:MAG: hypothetical protein K6F09_03680 [Clostridiales bacterium]|nr:hypothetical protein [Clostridiales bacterium]